MLSHKDRNIDLAQEGSNRESVSYCRIVVKAGTTLLTHGSDRVNLQVMATLAEQFASLHSAEVGTLLVSSGAVAAGRHALCVSSGSRNVPFKQVLAAVGQGRLMHAYEQIFDRHQILVAQALLTRADFDDRLGYLNVRNTLLSLLELGVIPIINENDVVADDELSGQVFGDNDSLSALVANLVDADLLVLLGQVDGLHTADPNVDPDATLVRTVERLDDAVEAMGGRSWNDQGQGGMATKLDAARLATASGIDVVIASGLESDVITRLARGERIGTFFPSTATKMESRKRWMLSELSNSSEMVEIVVDQGARRALVDGRGSLLPAGVVEVLGSFERGDIVSILDPARDRIAAGIVNYGSDDLAKIKGSQSDQIEQLVGHHYGDEAVHRNNMVVL
jgi:glutamate 5-kinase